MKSKDKQYKKGQESIIGKIIYGFLLFMPLFAIGVTCLYAIFNKNAYQSYSDKSISQQIEIDSNYSFIENKNYTITFNDEETWTSKGFKGTFHTDLSSLTTISIDMNLVKAIFLNQNTLHTYRLDTNTNSFVYYVGITINNYSEDVKNINFTYEKLNNNTYDTYTTSSNMNLFTNEYVTQSVSDVFYYAVDKVTESPLFSWAQNSIIYTTTSNTCNALSITTPFIPLLLSYWLIISVIYFLYDIALMLVWIIHRKIHELQETI